MKINLKDITFNREHCVTIPKYKWNPHKECIPLQKNRDSTLGTMTFTASMNHIFEGSDEFNTPDLISNNYVRQLQGRLLPYGFTQVILHGPKAIL